MTSEHPNIVIILTDQQPATSMSCAGNPYLNTPAMDSLAATGTRFERTYCTNPVCVPSRCSFMTGRLPSVIGMRKNGCRPDLLRVTKEILEDSLGAVLTRAGYEAVYGGKVHVPDPLHPEQQGFRILTTDERDGLAADAAAWLRSDHNRPWCLVTSFINPHDICYQAIRDSKQTEEERKLLKNGSAEIAALDEALQRPDGVTNDEFWSSHCPPLPDNHELQADEPEAIRWLTEERSFKKFVRETWTEQDWRMHRYALCRLTEKVDGQIGQLLDALRDSGQEENTVVIFTSDHGDLDASHRLEHKTALYEEAVRVPLIISQPGRTQAGAIEERLVSNGLDLIPTVCDYAGIEKPGSLPGRSLRPLAEGHPVATWRDHVAVESQIGQGIITANAKYVQYDFGLDQEQLYDRSTEPGEMMNAAKASRFQGSLEAHRELFDRHFGGVLV